MPEGRYAVVDQPTALPGKCYLTGSAGAESGPYIDTKQNIFRYGAVFFSAQAVEEMYRELKAHQGIDITVSASEEALKEAYASGFFDGTKFGHDDALENLQETILDDLARVVANRSAGIDPFAAPVDESEDVSEDAGESEGSKSGSDGTSEGTTSASGGKGRGRVSGRSDDDSDAFAGLEL